MQVFKCALRIIRGNMIFPLIYIVGLSLMGVLMASSFDFGHATDTFERATYNYAVIDRDQSDLSTSLKEVLNAGGCEIYIADEKEAIQDAAAKGQVDYLLIIPEGFEASFEDAAHTGGEAPQMDTVYSFYSINGTLVDSVVNGYLGIARSLLAAHPEASFASIADEAYSLALEQSDVAYLPTSNPASEADRFVFYLSWGTYVLFAGIVVCVGLVTSTIGRADVRRRNLASPITYVSYNAGLALACFTLAFFAAVWTFCLGLVAFPAAVAHITTAGLALCALSVGAFSLMAMAFGYMLGSFGASTMVCNAVGNIVGMVVSFFGGAWMSLDLMTPELSAFAHWLPGVWYSNACETAAHLSTPPATDSLIFIFQCIGVLLLFTVAFFCVALLAGKLRMQTSQAGGNRAAEAV